MTLQELFKKTMIPENKIPIYIPDAEAKQFIIFQQHYDVFTVLLDNNVFGQRNAAFTLHFDKNGILQTIQRTDFPYSRRHQKTFTTEG